MDFHHAVSAGSHLLTAFWAAFATLILLRLTRDHGVGRFSVAVFGLCMVLLFTSSAAFHGLKHGNADSVLLYQKIDKSAVFLLIAGSYTPIMAYLLRNEWRRFALFSLWTFTAIGVMFLWLLPEPPHNWLVAIYAATALSGLVPTPLYVMAINQPPLKWIAYIAGPYAGGALAEVLQKPELIPGFVGPHEVLHFAVTVGVFVHFIFITKHVVRKPPLRNSTAALATDAVIFEARATLDWAVNRLSGVHPLPKAVGAK